MKINQQVKIHENGNEERNVIPPLNGSGRTLCCVPGLIEREKEASKGGLSRDSALSNASFVAGDGVNWTILKKTHSRNALSSSVSMATILLKTLPHQRAIRIQRFSLFDALNRWKRMPAFVYKRSHTGSGGRQNMLSPRRWPNDEAQREL
ncbi:hypothetical protein CEXT_367751 [Caerostris extrusa]|uniref:Uncharacterized protein n=1 Tax=Caerostris extrusa TaxID=172846 RepID=A0AAV4REW3_CAEEX|nr:hypothetical protein CEXT_367751 [Caerostris extrusa]